MTRRLALVVLALALTVGLAGCKRGEPGSEGSAAGMDPAVAKRVQEMSAALTAAKTLRFTTDETRDRIDKDGKRTTQHLTRETIVRRPDGVWVHRVKDGKDLYIWYDGQTVTARVDSLKVFAQLPMPPTIDATLDSLATTYRFPMPTGDIIYSNPYEAFIGDSTTGRLVGEEQVGSVKCQHFSFQDVVNFDLWIEEGQRALPCKLDIVYEGLEGQPHYSITFTGWDLAPQISDDQFTASIPSDYRQIPVVGVSSERAAQDAAPEQPTGTPAGADTSSP
jgi:hypothetical protein